MAVIGDGHGLANFIETHVDEILLTYEESLRVSENAIARRRDSLDEAMVVARSVIADVIASLRSGQVRINDAYRTLARKIGTARAQAGVHPQESLHASHLLFVDVLQLVHDAVGREPEGQELFRMVVLSMERSINLRVSESLNSYTGFLLNRIQEAHAETRHQIARELHDRVGPGMSVAHQQLSLYNLYWKSDLQRANLKVEVAHRAIREAAAELRQATAGLRGRISNKSLEKALRDFLDSFETDATEVRIRVNGDESWACSQVMDEVFLVVREAALNALRHAEARVISININLTPYELRAVIEDDGNGFDRDVKKSSGMGLSSMCERADLLDGWLAVKSEVGSGTRVDFSVPLGGPVTSEQ
ncbi:ATP-binding protein [Streptomyces sp. NPDC005474]|uniref:sensor histidine kinase n=1 Tax=Streptomyces sp. NPDC005474 TaxID=3154878 RepID=UPI003453D691